MRPLAFKLLILLLTIFLLLSFSLSVFARPYREWLVRKDLEEQPWPGAARNSSYFMVIKTAYGFVLLPVIVNKSSKVSNTITEEKPTDSNRANEVVE